MTGQAACLNEMNWDTQGKCISQLGFKVFHDIARSFDKKFYLIHGVHLPLLNHELDDVWELTHHGLNSAGIDIHSTNHNHLIHPAKNPTFQHQSPSKHPLPDPVTRAITQQGASHTIQSS